MKSDPPWAHTMRARMVRKQALETADVAGKCRRIRRDFEGGRCAHQIRRRHRVHMQVNHSVARAAISPVPIAADVLVILEWMAVTRERCSTAISPNDSAVAKQSICRGDELLHDLRCHAFRVVVRVQH